MALHLISRFPAMNLAPGFLRWNTLYFLSYDNVILRTYFSVKNSGEWTTPQLFKGYSDELSYIPGYRQV